jgi:hypothetical protein
VEFTIEDTSVIPRTEADRKAAGLPSTVDYRYGIPALRTFSAGNIVVLRDGQQTEFSGSDKASGEIMKITLKAKVVQ